MGSVGGNNDDMGFQRGDEHIINRSSSGMGTIPYFAPGWDHQVVSLGQHENLGGSAILSQSEFTNSPYSILVESQGINNNAHLVNYPSDSTFVEMVPKLPCFGSGNFSDMVGSYGLSGSGQIASSICPPNYALNKESSTRCHGDLQLLEEAASIVNKRKRVRESNSHFDPNKNGEGELQKDTARESCDVSTEQDEKKPKNEHYTDTHARGKEATKQSKDDSNSGEAPPKENYIHVRARRGQATNSHSLAERMRREKISERMRLLQDLVPGCNKITGKAVMLDEIINYVQSLQQQVEFLSMKLATVNPELNFDFERFLSRDMLHPRSGNSSISGFSPMLNSNPYSQGVFQPNITVIPNTNLQFPSMPQNALDNELQNLFQMGFNSASAINSFGPNGQLKPEA
ncbi:hypothetical protein K2173_007960 [Erythroxylum novogranatense]|uniref:BHLH domain-containing protein n=1 Tax=Erythroxylum novogranatense TaxID=1862640 RepID=A0AAV8T6V5_9ROSI|nr:hypothetical protein K2173_007960 [Erythroxylum novogranatense]